MSLFPGRCSSGHRTIICWLFTCVWLVCAYVSVSVSVSEGMDGVSSGLIGESVKMIIIATTGSAVELLNGQAKVFSKRRDAQKVPSH